MPRFTICVDVNEPDEAALADAWLNKWQDKVEYLSKNQGCGCCVNIYDVEGSEAAFSELSLVVLAESGWSRGAQSKRA